MLAPNAPLRLAATAYGRDADLGGAPPPARALASPAATKARPSAHYPCALLIARLFLTLPLVCPNCGADMRIIAFVTETPRCGEFSPTSASRPSRHHVSAPPAGRRPGTIHRSILDQAGMP